VSGNRKKYTPEYREQAVRLVVDTGRPAAHVAAEIGVGEQLPGRWVAAAKARSATDNPEVLDDDERAELERLRKETPNYVSIVRFEKCSGLLRSEQNR
jgi:transposase